MDETARERLDEIFNTDGSSVAYRIESLKQFLREFPENGPVWAMLGRELTAVARFAEAEQALIRAMELSESTAIIHLYMGNLFGYRGDPPTAELWYGKAIDDRPDDATGYIYLGCLFARLGRLSEAEVMHRRGTACKMGCVDEAQYNLGLVLRGQGRYAEAAACFEAALQLDPQYKLARLAKRDVERAMRVCGAERGEAVS